MRLKDLLYENSPKEDAEKFLRLIRSGDYIVPQKRGFDLFRGTDRSVQVGVKKEYTDTRTPMNTPADTQRMLDIIIKTQRPDWPQRGLSRFAATYMSNVKSYGDIHYVFPHENSKIVSFNNDAFVSYFGKRNEKPGHFRDEFRKYIDKSGKKWGYLSETLGEQPTEFLMGYYLAIEGGDYNLFRKLAERSYISKHVEVFNKANDTLAEMDKEIQFPGFNHLYTAVLTAKAMAENILQYFEEGEMGLENHSREVIIQGDLLHVHKNMVDDYLEFDEGRNEWQLGIFG